MQEFPNSGDNLAAIDPTSIERRRLDRLDSPRRIAWLRGQVRGYIIDLAARAYFRLPTCCGGREIPDPKAEAHAACADTADSHGLTPAEAEAAFTAEWKVGMALTQQVAEKVKIAALSHMKAAGTTEGLVSALLSARNKFPVQWPYLSEDDLDLIGAGFRRPAQRRKAA